MIREIKGYDDWKLDSGFDDEFIFGECDQCGREFYQGDEIMYLKGLDMVHQDCFEEYAEDKLVLDQITAGE